MNRCIPSPFREFKETSVQVCLSLALLFTSVDSVSAQPDTGSRGGHLADVGTVEVETVLSRLGIRFYLVDSDGTVFRHRKASGVLQLKVGDSPKVHALRLEGLKGEGIGAAVNLTKVVGKELHLDAIIDFPGRDTIFLQTSVKLSFVDDKLLASLQRTCPITGKRLGSMGAPLKVMLDGKPLFVCCQPCAKKLKSESAKHFKQYYAPKQKEVRPGIFEASLADAGAIEAQYICPVMNKDLGSMGPPMKVNLDGKAVYVCCLGCVKKLQDSPKEYLEVLASQGIGPLSFDSE